MSYSKVNEQQLQAAYHHISIQRFPRAYEILKQLLSTDPNNAELLYLSSLCLYYLDNYSEAIDNCKQALNNGYANEFCYYLLGKIYMECNNYLDAEKCFLKL